ncbi:hypothetical protein [Pontibaca salina]|uniref:Uncharacterized protein n=1 Tax=Pontibaca salina TaxID=2795731 RepID=A0A934HPS0_9RHOB|nr:hypothetical protein [Pontibaca salina]MBI6628310.1 hypothetical protein [Pontibaca salina]
MANMIRLGWQPLSRVWLVWTWPGVLLGRAAMSATLIALLSGAVGVIATALGAYIKGRRDGATQGERHAAEVKAASLEKAKGVRDEVDAKSSHDVHADLADWMRDTDR